MKNHGIALDDSDYLAVEQVATLPSPKAKQDLGHQAHGQSEAFDTPEHNIPIASGRNKGFGSQYLTLHLCLSYWTGVDTLFWGKIIPLC